MDANTPVLILAGGFGTRLKSVVDDRPKPMAEGEEGKPFLLYLIEWLKEQGARKFVLLTHFMTENIQDFFGDGSEFGVEVSYSVEDSPLGTGGAMIKAVRELNINSPFLLLNGDSFIDADVNQFLSEVQDGKGGIVLRRVPDVSRFGSVDVDSEKNLAAFLEKQSKTGEGLINAGIYYFSPEVFEQWGIEKLSLETDLFPAIIQNGVKVKTYESSGHFIDIGTPESFQSFRDYISTRPGL